MDQTWTLEYWSDSERQPCVEKWLDQRTPQQLMHGYRIYYGFLPKHRIVILHAGDKGSQQNDIKLARERLTKIQQREAVANYS